MAKLFQCFSFRDVRTSAIKLQLNNAAGGRLYFTRPHIPERLETFHMGSQRANTDSTVLTAIKTQKSPKTPHYNPSQIS